MAKPPADDHLAFEALCRQFAAGEVDNILMHIDTVRELSRDDWDRLARAGAEIVTISRS